MLHAWHGSNNTLAHDKEQKWGEEDKQKLLRLLYLAILLFSFFLPVPLIEMSDCLPITYALDLLFSFPATSSIQP